MSEHDGGTGSNSGNGGDASDRLAAHERLSTGALARWYRACATHPRRVFLSWVGIIVVLIALVATIGGGLKDEFNIPGSDTQKATDLIESEFASEQGGVLNSSSLRPRASGWTPPSASRRSRTRSRSSRPLSSSRPRTGPGSRASADPFDPNTFSDNGRIAYAEAQFDRVIFDKDRDARRRRPGSRPRSGRAGRGHGRVQRRRRVPADRAGAAGAARPAGRADRPDRRLPHLRGGVDPDSAGADGAGDRVHPALHPRRPDRHQHDHAAPRVDDRARCRHRLLAVHRHPLPAAPARRAVAGRRRLRGRSLRGPRRALRRPDGRDLGHRPRLLRPRLRHQARHRLRARRPDDGGDRELAADLGPGKAGAQGRPVESAVPAPARRLRGGAGKDSDRPLGPLRDRTCEGRVLARPRLVVGLACTSALVRLGASDQGTQPKEQTARRAYDLLAEGFGPGFNGPIPIVVDVNGDQQAAEKIHDRVQGLPGVASVGEPQFNDEKTVALVFVTPTSAPQDEATGKLVRPLAERRRAGRNRRRRRGRLRLRPDRGVQGHRRTDHGAVADLPALHHRRHLPRARDGLPVDRDLADGGDHDDPLGVRRLRRPDAGGAGGPPARASLASTERGRSRPSCHRSRSRSSSGSRWTTWSS